MLRSICMLHKHIVSAECVHSLISLAQNRKLMKLVMCLQIVTPDLILSAVHSFVVMASSSSLLDGIALGGIGLCQNLIKANVEQPSTSTEEQFKQSAAQSGG